jgi:hypothetical protein
MPRPIFPRGRRRLAGGTAEVFRGRSAAPDPAIGAAAEMASISAGMASPAGVIKRLEGAIGHIARGAGPGGPVPGAERRAGTR